MRHRSGDVAAVLAAVFALASACSHEHRSASHPVAQPRSAVSDCRAAELSGRVVARGGEASQTSDVVVLRNRAPQPCTLSGYPQVRAEGGPELDVRRGATYVRRDPGPRRIVLPPGGAASFALSTATAFRYPATISELTVRLAGMDRPLALPCRLGLSGPTPASLPLTVTAAVAGSSGPPQQ